MASINNAFSLLTGAEQQLNKKKKNKKPAANGNAPQPSSAPAAKAAPQPAAVALPVNTDLTVGVSEACAIIERGAREAKQQADKVKLWKEWTRQANDKASKLKYADVDGTNLDFKQVILRSKALEICAESCISTPLHPDKESALAQMFASFLPNEGGACNNLANLLVRLSNSLAGDAPDTLGAAQRAVSGIVQSLKAAASRDGSEAEAANPVVTWLERVSSLDKEIARAQTSLTKLTAVNKGVVTREVANTARQLVRLHEEKFDLLQPESIPTVKPPSGALGACLRGIEELKAVISGHLKESESKSAGAASQDAAARSAQAASYKREAEILAAQAAQVSSQIRTLEAQLYSLRAQAAEIEEKRAALAARQQASWEGASAASSSKGGKPQSALLTPAHYRESLVLAEALADLADPSRLAAASPEQVLNVQTAQVNSPVEYVAAAESLLGVALGALGEVPAKLSFCRQRIAQATKLVQLGALAGKAVEDSKRQQEEAEKLMADTLRMAEELVATAAQVRADAHRRYDAMARFNPEKAATVAGHIRNIDALEAQVQQQHSVVLATASGAAPPPSAPAAPTAAAPAAATTTYIPLTGASIAPVAAPSAAAGRPAAGARGPAAAAAPQKVANGAAAAPRPAVPAAPTRQWAKVETPAPVSLGDSALPTPAEAFRPAETGPSTSDGFKAVGGGGKGRNRRKGKNEAGDS